MPTPEVNWPLQPIAPDEGPPGQLIGVFIMLRGKLKPPLSRSLYRFQTDSVLRLLVPLTPSLAITAWVQLAKPLQYPVPFNAASKNGCGVTALALAAQFPPPMLFTPPQYAIRVLA